MLRYNLECVVLKSINYRDADRIYTLFARDRGRVLAVARGVRKISSRRGGSLDTLNHVSIGISENESGYKTITETKILTSFRGVKSTLENSINGYYVLELIYRFMEDEQENNKIYNLLLNTLDALNRSRERFNEKINVFEVQLMSLLGYNMALDRCLVCDRRYNRSWESTKFNVGLGGFICSRCSGGIPISEGVTDYLNLLRYGQIFENSKLEDLRFANNLIKTYVSSVLEDTIRTPRIFGYFNA